MSECVRVNGALHCNFRGVHAIQANLPLPADQWPHWRTDELDLHICDGRGGRSRLMPGELIAIADRVGIDD